MEEYTSTMTSLDFSEEEIKKYNELLNVLFINMYGEATRDGGIYIKEFDDGVAGKITYKVAECVAGLYGIYVYLDCSFWEYVKFLIKNKLLFKKRYVRRMKGYKKGHTQKEWLYDITTARGEDEMVWFDVYDFIRNN